MPEKSRALVVIDLQNEFLDPQGHFPILPSSKTTLLTNLALLLPQFRKAGGHVIWIKSIYKNDNNTNATVSPLEADLHTLDISSEQGEPNSTRETWLAGTHRGSIPCCPQGSLNAELYPEVASQVSESEDSVITKTFFSAFTETSLLATLRINSIKDVFFCGLYSSTCVLATIRDAVQIPGFNNIYAVRDCLGWKYDRSHRRALERFQDLGVRVVDHPFAIQENLASPTLTIPELYYVNGSIPSWRVHIALYEKGIKVNQIRMRVMTHPKPTRLPFFLALNHRGKTPVFIDTDPDRTTVNESLAILTYLETYYPQTPLLPPIDQRKYRARVLSLVQETENLHNAYDELEEAFFKARQTNTTTTQDFRTTTRPALLKTIYKELQFWEKYAEESEGGFIAGGEGVTLADCAFYPLLAYMLRRGFEFEERWEGLRRYHERMWGRDGVRRAQPEGWDGTGKADIFKGT